ncbi:MAG: class I SAM-dependent methyltransferase [Myxococcales bacterium]|nr:class I SAM-dependent methyltransferase [Myxococcales bacterium]
MYDLVEWFMELRASGWRRQLWSLVEGKQVLEIGVGTGASLRHHPSGARIVAIDISERMLLRARRKAERLGVGSTLMLGDAQELPFADDSFDSVISSFVFCSIPDPLLGLREARRVLRPGGRLLLLEHVLSERPVLRQLMRWMDPIASRISGAHIDRATVATVEEAGFVDVETIDRSLDVVKQITAYSP